MINFKLTPKISFFNLSANKFRIFRDPFGGGPYNVVPQYFAILHLLYSLVLTILAFWFKRLKILNLEGPFEKDPAF